MRTELCVYLCVFWLPVSVNQEGSATTQEENMKLGRFQLWRVDLKPVGSESLTRTRAVSDAGVPAGGDSASRWLPFCRMDFPEAPRPESTGGLTGSQSISHKVSADAGMGDELEAGEVNPSSLCTEGFMFCRHTLRFCVRWPWPTRGRRISFSTDSLKIGSILGDSSDSDIS